MFFCLAIESAHGQPSQFFNGETFDLKKLADADAISTQPIPQSAKLWMKLETLYKDANSSDSALDQELLTQIKADQETNRCIHIENVWKLFQNRMSEHRYSDAGSCITLSETLLSDVPNDSPASKTLQKNIALLEHVTRTKRAEKVRHGYVTLTTDPAVTTTGISTGARSYVSSMSVLRPRGYTGIRLVDGKVDSLNKYSPAAILGVLQFGDQIVSINGLPLNDCSTQESWRLSNGVQGEVTHFVYIHTGQQKTLDIVSEAYPSLQNLYQLTAREKFELGSQLREIGYMSDARIALEQAAIADPGGEYATLAIKVLQSRMCRYVPPKRCNDIYMRAYFGNFDHEEVKAEALFRYCISQWPQFEMPYRQLAGLLIKEARLREAETVANQLLVVNPDYARGWKVMARIKSQLGDKQGSTACSQKANELDPDDK
jgi:tetratricopeptide (TPR) repeat protein